MISQINGGGLGIGGGKLADYRSSRHLLTQQKRRADQHVVRTTWRRWQNTASDVDFMSLDVEGHEAKVLRVKKVRINHILGMAARC